MLTITAYTPADVFHAMDTAKTNKAVLPDGHTFKKNSARMILFKTKGTHCITCGIEGTTFVLETQSKEIPPHLNLYAINNDGEKILMTKDHHQPKSKGGPNTLNNYNTMCAPCNTNKADTYPENHKQ
jgi:5-methylcytosine-specific restriction endonuclease McrA